MTNYNLKPKNSPSLFVREKKEKRQKVLEAVRERRKEIYKRLQKKMQLQADSDLL
ncbi:MAG TPA: hypothetical protein VEP90_09995 [Methylomirabilota bacterium]|nr:hypothetical protein [Methylomirabilota bacterium]